MLFSTAGVILLIAVGIILWAGQGSLSKKQFETGFLAELPGTANPSGTNSSGLLTANKPNGRYTIVTYNIGYCSGLTNNSKNNATKDQYAQNLQSIITALRKVNPDLVAMQEIDLASARSFYQNQPLLISEGLGLRHYAYDYNWDDHYVPWPYGWPRYHFGRLLSGHCVASRFPIAQHSKVTLDKPEENPFWYNMFYLDRIIQITEVAIDSHPLVIMNLHLEAYKRQTRQKQAMVVAEVFKQYAGKPVIMVGDFNARPPAHTDETTLDTILAVPGIHKEFPLEVYENSEKNRYYTSNSDHPTSSIDHIFYNDHIKCISAHVLQEAGTGSDHLPVMMEFEFN